MILGLRPSKSSKSDDYSWFFIKSDNYTVCSGYWRARELLRQVCNPIFWDRVLTHSWNKPGN